MTDHPQAPGELWQWSGSVTASELIMTLREEGRPDTWECLTYTRDGRVVKELWAWPHTKLKRLS